MGGPDSCSDLGAGNLGLSWAACECLCLSLAVKCGHFVGVRRYTYFSSHYIPALPSSLAFMLFSVLGLKAGIPLFEEI